MDVSRRDFLKISGGTMLLGAVDTVAKPDSAGAQEKVPELRIKDARVTTTICPYCSVGCGILMYTKDGKVINSEGDPEHPINEGSLCPKGASLYEMVHNKSRVLKPLYRAPGATEWKEVEWDWALDKIARNVKDARDRTFKATSKIKVKEKKKADTPDESGLFPEIEVTTEKEFTVNRCDGIAHIGSAAMDNEECYLMQKLMRSWGVVYIEHQARI